MGFRCRRQVGISCIQCHGHVCKILPSEKIVPIRPRYIFLNLCSLVNPYSTQSQLCKLLGVKMLAGPVAGGAARRHCYPAFESDSAPKLIATSETNECPHIAAVSCRIRILSHVGCIRKLCQLNVSDLHSEQGVLFSGESGGCNLK
jgi:hypothetical protein